MTNTEIESIETALTSPNPRAVLDAFHATGASTNHAVYCGIWECAMTLAYGPLGTHKSRTDEHDHPLPETLAAFPAIGRRMDEARRRLTECLIPRAREIAAGR